MIQFVSPISREIIFSLLRIVFLFIVVSKICFRIWIRSFNFMQNLIRKINLCLIWQNSARTCSYFLSTLLRQNFIVNLQKFRMYVSTWHSNKLTTFTNFRFFIYFREEYSKKSYSGRKILKNKNAINVQALSFSLYAWL